MRFKSQVVDGYQIFAVTGVNTISFAIASDGADTAGLLGFAVERLDPTELEHYFMQGLKVFESVIPHPGEGTVVSTFEHPVQSFVWDDFTGKENRVYDYLFHPLKGRAKNLERSAAPIPIRVQTEPLFSPQTHDVFFNRGVASSQAYARRFHNKAPDQLDPPLRQEAEDWLSRDLDDALLRFVRQSGPGDTLLGCFYEFRYLPVAQELKSALERGVDVRLIVDAKVNESTDSDGVFHPSFPREENLAMLAAAGIPPAAVTLRQARRSDIQHNKFMVLVRAGGGPEEVWTGSTNLSVGGIHGQTNVGHWVRDAALAQKFQRYWTLLQGDPGAAVGDDRVTVRRKNDALKAEVEAISPDPHALADVPNGVTPVFSPRRGLELLDLYTRAVDGAESVACITLAFGIHKSFKHLLQDNTAQNALVFMLLEKRDAPNPNSSGPFVAINASNNVYKAWGSFLRSPLHQWARETSARGLGLNTHVAFIHSKFLLRDPLGSDPLVITGSANFSEASENGNDENMIYVRGDRRVADIYFTEFNRLFHHYYFRSVIEELRRSGRPTQTEASLFLSETDDWLAKYRPGTFRRKRVEMMKAMTGFTAL